MGTKDDRDFGRPKTSPGVPALPESEWEGESAGALTPIEGDQATQTNRRATAAASNSKAAFAAIREVRADVKAYAEADKADHAEMKGNISEIRTDVKTLNEHVGNVRETLGEVSGQLGGIMTSLERDHENRHMLLTARLETGRIEKTYQLKTKFEWFKTILRVAAALAIAAGCGWIGYLIEHASRAVP